MNIIVKFHHKELANILSALQIFVLHYKIFLHYYALVCIYLNMSFFIQHDYFDTYSIATYVNPSFIGI